LSQDLPDKKVLRFFPNPTDFSDKKQKIKHQGNRGYLGMIRGRMNLGDLGRSLSGIKLGAGGLKNNTKQPLQPYPV